MRLSYAEGGRGSGVPLALCRPTAVVARRKAVYKSTWPQNKLCVYYLPRVPQTRAEVCSGPFPEMQTVPLPF